MYKVLSVSSHYGGGVGAIIKAIQYNDKDNKYTFSYLNDVPENKKDGHVLFDINMVKEHDIVLMHVWNHPLFWKLITQTKLPECRLIGWSHMAGNHPPYTLFDRLKKYFDAFYYTSPVSGKDCDYIWSSCSIDDYLNIEKKPHNGFNIGYMGTIDFCKLHPKFVDICKKIDIPDVRFTILGGGCDFDTLKEQIGDDKRFTLTGQVADVKPYMKEFDVFLYPLNPKHFGTCEQVLGQIMATGIPVIALDNHAERYIIQNNVNGYLCKNIDEIIQKINNIYNGNFDYNKEESKEIAKRKYSVESTLHYLNNAFDNVMKKEKTEKLWIQNKHVFLESLGDYSDLFESFPMQLMLSNPYHWKSENKGSIKQYLRYFPDDEYLKYLGRLLDEMPNM